MITVPEWYNASVVVDRNLEAGRAGKVAIYCGEDEVTYGELTGRIARLGHALRTELGREAGGQGSARAKRHALLPRRFFRRDAHRGRPHSRQHVARGLGLPFLPREQPRQGGDRRRDVPGANRAAARD